jgi:hypothetical protein
LISSSVRKKTSPPDCKTRLPSVSPYARRNMPSTGDEMHQGMPVGFP